MADVATLAEPELRLLLELLDDQAVFRLDSVGRVTSWNAGAERLTGFPEEEILDERVARLYGPEPEMARAAEHDLARVAREGKIEDRGWRRRADGSRYFARAILATLRDRSGRLSGYLGLLRDLTSTWAAQESSARRDWLETVLQQLPVGVVICEAPSGRILVANESAVEIMGSRPAPECTIRDAPWRVRRLDGTLLSTEELALSRAIARGERARLEECWLERTDGVRRRLRLNAGPIYERGERGERIVAGVVAFVDVTGEAEARAEVTRTARYRELLIGMLGHDLRNPLSAILMAAQLLRRGNLPATSGELVVRIRASAERMLRMIEQVLDLTRARLGGGIPIQRQRFDLVSMCRRVISELEVANPGRQIDLAAPPSVSGEWDESRLERLVSNLVGNALQHGDPARPVAVALRDLGERVELEVENLGPTIAPETLQTLFDPFHRASARKGEGDGEGLGLGLYIAQQVVVAHGGAIEVRSTAGRTVVTARVPR